MMFATFVFCSSVEAVSSSAKEIPSLQEMALKTALIQQTESVAQVVSENFKKLAQKDASETDISSFLASKDFDDMIKELVDKGEHGKIVQSLVENAAESFNLSPEALEIINRAFYRFRMCLSDAVPESFLRQLVRMEPFPLEFVSDGPNMGENFHTHAVFKLNLNSETCKTISQTVVPVVQVLSQDLLQVECQKPIIVNLKRECAVQSRQPANIHLLVQTGDAIIDHYMQDPPRLYLHSSNKLISTFQGTRREYEKVIVRNGKLVLNPGFENETVLEYEPPLKDLSRYATCTQYGWSDELLRTHGFTRAAEVLKTTDNREIVLLRPLVPNGKFMLGEYTRQ